MKKFKQNIKQSWQIIKQNKLYSFFYILGTALAISMVMVLAIGYNLKVGNIYPEVNRDRILVLKNIHQKTFTSNSIQEETKTSLSNDFIKKLIAEIEEIEAVCIRYCWSYKHSIQKDMSSVVKEKIVSLSNEGVWLVHQFDFIDGRPFTKEEVENYSPLAVISASTAKSIFGDEPAVDKKIWINRKEFKICGIVKDVSPLIHTSYADIYLPIPASLKMKSWFSAAILAKSSKDFDKIKTQIKDNLAKTNNSLDGIEFGLLGGPYSFTEENLAMNTKEGKADAASKHILQLIIIVLVVIMVPTFNISGIISTEMGEREAEIGIRKAFGAPRWELLYSLTNENLLLTFIGGILGVLLSYLFIYIGYQLFLSFFVINESTLPWLNMEMLINYKVILIAFTSCLFMNLLSSIIPQYFSTNKNIVSLLKRNNIRRGKSKRGKHMWIFMELLVVYVVAWMIIDPLYVLNYQKSIHEGFEYENSYTINVPSYREETKEGTEKYGKIILEIIKNHPFVENVVLQYDLPIASSTRQTTAIHSLSKDSLETKISLNILSMPPNNKNYFSIQGIKIPENLDEEDLQSGSILISKSVAKIFFGDAEAIGKKMVQGYVIGVIDDIKAMQYEQPIPTIIEISNSFRPYGFHHTFVSFLVKSKPGISKEKFIKTFTDDLGDKFNMGNRFFSGIAPYSKRIEEDNLEITQQKKMYTIFSCFVLINMFLGIFATFWLQSKKRRGEIGLRMAMGSSKKKVSRMFVMQSVKMASLAALVGMIVVGNIVYFKGMFTYGEYQNPEYWAVTNPTAHFVIVSLIAYAVIILTVTLGTLIPASKAANTNPVDALRDE